MKWVRTAGLGFAGGALIMGGQPAEIVAGVGLIVAALGTQI